MARALQHGAAALRLTLPATSAGGGDDSTTHDAQQLRPNWINPSQASHALTFCPDHSMGAGHRGYARRLGNNCQLKRYCCYLHYKSKFLTFYTFVSTSIASTWKLTHP